MYLKVENLDSSKSDSFYKIYGKICLLSNKFEYSCKDIIRWLLSLKYIGEGSTSIFSDDLYSYTDKLLTFMLGNLISNFKLNKEYFQISEDDIVLITRAKDIRNWIAHDLIIDWIEKSVFVNNDYLDSFKCNKEICSKVETLITAEYLVNSWYAKFTHVQDTIDKEIYVSNICRWVYE